MSNQQPVVDVNLDVIIEKAKQAYELFKKYDDNPDYAYLNARISRAAADCVPELLRILIEVSEQNQLLKQENEDHRTAREYLSNKWAENLALLYEKEY